MKQYEENKKASLVQEDAEPFMRSFSSQEEAERFRLERDVNRSDMEKFRLFTNMLRRNALYGRAKISDNNTGS